MIGTTAADLLGDLGRMPLGQMSTSQLDMLAHTLAATTTIVRTMRRKRLTQLRRGSLHLAAIDGQRVK
jgi:hypothetical protein